ncbi:MAG: ABC transporter ATP-binding protein, partial [Balneolaceae bacterium]
LLVLMFVGAFLEVLGVGMLPGFVAIIATPDRVFDVELLAPVLKYLNITDGGDLLVLGAITLILVFLLKNGYLIFFRYIEARFVFRRYASVGSQLFDRYMSAPYSFSLARNSSELLRNVTSEAHLLISAVLSPALKMLKDAIMIAGIFLLLVFVEPLISLLVFILLGGASTLLLKALRNRMKSYGKQALLDRHMLIRAVNEGLGGLKDVIVLNRENWFVKRFNKHVNSYARSQLFKQVAAGSTKPVIETIAVGGMLGIALLLYLQGRSLEVIIPILTLFGAATLRLMPAIQEIVTCYNNLRYHIYSVEPVHRDLMELPVRTKDSSASGKLAFRNVIRFEQVGYHYPNANAQAVDEINLSIRRGEAVGFVGPSGAGKTTLVDMLLALLEPQEGEITVDGTPIFENPSAWQRNVGYIPQFIFLSDDTIRRNIAFGLPDHEIDKEAVQSALEAAQLTDLIQDLEKGLDTVIGERGVRLSGGQRQRIGIARALYHNPSVLIMDEATSALDNVTEKYVIDAIEQFKGERTIVMIAHRLTTVQYCDMLYFMNDGRVTDQGTYED